MGEIGASGMVSHHTTHEVGGSDEIAGIPSVPDAHKTSHQNAGTDEISVAGLSGELADDQPTTWSKVASKPSTFAPTAHHGDHENGGSDEIDISGLAGATEIVDTPADGETTKGISSNWAFDHNADSTKHPPVFVDRGDPAAYDFTQATLTTDGAWHDLDLSSIVPAGAKAILIRGKFEEDATGRVFYLRKNGNSNTINIAGFGLYVANTGIFIDLIVVPDANRVIEYFASAVTWSEIGLVVAGWWI